MRHAGNWRRSLPSASTARDGGHEAVEVSDGYVESVVSVEVASRTTRYLEHVGDRATYPITPPPTSTLTPAAPEPVGSAERASAQDSRQEPR